MGGSLWPRWLKQSARRTVRRSYRAPLPGRRVEPDRLSFLHQRPRDVPPTTMLPLISALGFLVVAFVASPLLSASAATAASAYLVANVAYAAGVTASPRRGAVSLMIAFYFCLLVALPASVQVRLREFPFDATYASADLKTAILLAAVAQMVHQVGVAYYDSRDPRGTFSGSGAPRRVSPDSNARQASLALAVVAVMVTLCLGIAAMLGPGTLFMYRHDLGEIVVAEGIKPQLHRIGRCLSIVAAVVVIINYRDMRRLGVSPVPLPAVAGVTALVFAVFQYPPGLARFEMIAAGLAVALAGVNFFNRAVKIGAFAGGAFALFFVFPTIKALGAREQVDWAGMFGRDIGAYLLRVDFDSYQQLVNTVVYLEHGEYRYFYNFLGVLFYWVPRSLWPGKPVHSGEIVHSDLRFWYSNVSSPLPAEAMLAGGWFAVLLVFVVLARCVTAVERRVHEAHTGHPASKHWIPVYAVLAGYVPIIMRGSLNATAPMYVTAIVAGLVYAVAMRWAGSNSSNARSATHAAAEILPGCAVEGPMRIRR